MEHEIHRIVSARIIGSYVVEIVFEDSVTKKIDLEPVLHGEMYGPLKSPILFQQISIDKESGTVFWPNGADFDPATLRYWESNVDELQARAREWESGVPG